MNNIDLKNWKYYKISEIFDIKKTENIVKESAEERKGNKFPYVTRSRMNNGVIFFVDESFNFNPKNTITIAGEGANVFYQERKYITGNNIHYLHSEKLNKYNALFIVTILSMEKYRYAYNRAFNYKCIKNTKIKLPAINNDEPDWEYMEKYIKKIFEKERESKQLSEKFINKRLSFDIKNWKPFKIKQILDILKIKKFSHIPEEEGKIKFISSSSENFGVISNTNIESTKKECITVSTNGACFDSFYHKGPIAVSTDVEVLSSKFLNKYNGLFISTLLNLEKFKWGYGRKPKKGNVGATVINLPIDNNGRPDWEYMEKYIKTLPYSKYI